MVRSCEIIAQGLGAVLTDKDSACVSHLHHHLEGILGHDLHMLGCDLVSRINGFIHILCNENVSEILQGFLNDLSSGENLQIAINLFLHILGQLSAGGNEDCRSHLVVLCLGKKVSCNIVWVGSLICKNQDLTWSCDRINADMAVNGFLCQCYENISRSHDLVYFRDAGSTVGKCADSLCAAYLVDLVSAGFLGCN